MRRAALAGKPPTAGDASDWAVMAMGATQVAVPVAVTAVALWSAVTLAFLSKVDVHG